MKTLVKKITAFVMAIVIIISTINVPQEVKAADFYTVTLNANGGYFSKMSSNITTIKMPSTAGLKVLGA